MTDPFRCSQASLADAEPLGGTAPTEPSYLLLEHPGPWGRKAVAESTLPPAVRAHLDALPDTRVQLVRRHGGGATTGVRVFTARPGGEVRTALLADAAEVVDLRPGDLTPYDGPLWLVCTNGRRDRCCAEDGRPVAAALATAWPEATWETTHLGGHRFAATLLALPSGVTLGRLDPATAVEACREVSAGRHPLARSRGRAGLDPRAQVADLHLRAELGLADLDAVRVLGTDGDDVLLEGGDRPWRVTVARVDGPPRRQSCADLTAKPAPVYRVTAWVPWRAPTPPQEDA